MHIVEPEGSLKFQRTIQRGINHRLALQTEDRPVCGVDVLLALFLERDCHAVEALFEVGVTRQRVIHAQLSREGWKNNGDEPYG
jgi:hypothetical protein